MCVCVCVLAVTLGVCVWGPLQVPFLCPLEGHVHLQLQCEVGSRLEDRGFLVSGSAHPPLAGWPKR